MKSLLKQVTGESPAAHWFARRKIEIQKRRTLTLCDRLVAKAAMIGEGNISAGVRKALEAYPQRVQLKD